MKISEIARIVGIKYGTAGRILARYVQAKGVLKEVPQHGKDYDKLRKLQRW